jgi:SAM-dependent methyltransferase
VRDPDLLADPVAYWEQRHADLDTWRAGGDRGLSEAENYEFYAYRLGRLIELIRRHAGGERPLRILDAGCGRGHLTDGLRRCGHRVTGIDASPTAIAWARKTYGPGFEEARLDAYRPAAPFDAVVCIDVLFHVLDDEVWRSCVAALGRYAAAESHVFVTGVFPERRFVLGSYIVHRSAAEVDQAFAAADFLPVERLPYGFGSNQNQFCVYRRAA